MSGVSSVDEGEYYSPGQSQSHMQGDPNDAHPQGSHSPLFLSEDHSPTPPTAISEVSPTFAIHVPPVERPWEYADYEDYTVDEVLRTIGAKSSKYSVRLVDGRKLTVTFSQLQKLDGGDAALDRFQQEEQGSSEEFSPGESRKPKRREQPRRGASRILKIQNSDMSSDELATDEAVAVRKTSRLNKSKAKGRKSSQHESHSTSDVSEIAPRKSSRNKKSKVKPNYKEPPANFVVDDETSDEGSSRPKRKGVNKVQPNSIAPPMQGTRRSSRARQTVNDLRELSDDDIPEVDVGTSTPKAIGAKEAFQSLPKGNEFRLRHNQFCDSCNESGSNEEKGRIIFCQGCTVAYHQKCLGPRNSREHLVTKIDNQDFVLQCRRCVEVASNKDQTAPKQGRCKTCGERGASTKPFRARQNARDEQKARENNEGEDPVTEISPDLVNNINNVMFRCINCYQAHHMHHLPPIDQTLFESEGLSDEVLAINRFAEYSRRWTCHDCLTVPGEVESLVAWRPLNAADYSPEVPTGEDNREYLVRWKKLSYFKCTWMRGSWVWGIASATMRKAFNKRDDNLKLTTEDAIPEDYLRVDIIFEVNYTNVVKTHTEEIDKARIKEVQQALVKYKGLGYDDVVWEDPPNQDDSERWADFRTAYNDWVSARYIHLPKKQSLNAYISKLRAQDFAKHMKMQSQPRTLTGGELMKYQLDGLNWLYYQWHEQHNVILADEMGLGKTIQVIGFLATLQLHGCWPFLIVVPNATCANWRREIKLWAPSLRVVTYFGSAEAKKLASKYELFHPTSKDLKCHIVVTSYDAAQDDEFRRVFRGVNWIGLVVDEGQRLKNDKNLLYGALNNLRIPFKLLLTGTPLQNNARELFNLLQFLDDSIDAQAMDTEYENLTKDNVPQLHELLRPFFLRRTKAHVLDFLPPMAQIIIPVSLTNVQQKLYMSIMAKNKDLIRAIFGGSTRVPKTERANLNNILMQVRKCLCHPFVYNRAIEEKSSNPIMSHRNLVDASSKLQLLEIMLPKLQERGHRVLIFSQFLDMLDIVEDFLDGLGLFYQRLDGSMNSLQKQKRIDEFNAPDSTLFAFLLSTRAGGVGINLATADTVIILDPDFNPHQDIQALSRAHRIGQKKKVLVFQIITRSTSEEHIMQRGKKKMALDHVLIEQMDAEDDAGMDIESMLRHGADKLFQNELEDIRYDSQSVDKLLDRSQVENTSTGKDDTAESQFSFARVWENSKGTLEDSLNVNEDESKTPDRSLWDKILNDREAEVRQEAAERQQALGRGKRVRQTVDYTSESRDVPGGLSPRKRAAPNQQDDSDTDFDEKASSEAEEEEASGDEKVNLKELENQGPKRKSISHDNNQISPTQSRAFKRAMLPVSPVVDGSTELASPTNAIAPQPLNEVDKNVMPATCLACGKPHAMGYCPLKHAGVEHCPLCGIAHYGHYRTCPHLSSLTQCRRMLDALKQSTEPVAERKRAKQYLVGIIGDLNRRRRREQQPAQGEAGEGLVQISSATHTGMPGQAPSMSSMHRVVNGGVQGLPVQQHPTDHVRVPSRSLGHEGVIGHHGAVNQRFDGGNATYPLPYGRHLANSNGQFQGLPPSTGTEGG